jgi:hypothetical protein
MQGPGGPAEDRSGGFERGGWARPPKPLFDNEAMTFICEVYQRADAFLFGRRTYELFAVYWGVREDLGHPIVGALNTRPKYVVSNTLTEPRWAPQSVNLKPRASPLHGGRSSTQTRNVRAGSHRAAPCGWVGPIPSRSPSRSGASGLP